MRNSNSLSDWKYSRVFRIDLSRFALLSKNPGRATFSPAMSHCGRQKVRETMAKITKCPPAKQSAPMICKFGRVSATAVSAAFQMIATRKGGRTNRSDRTRRGYAQSRRWLTIHGFPGLSQQDASLAPKIFALRCGSSRDFVAHNLD
jgi:hypothetical protein